MKRDAAQTIFRTVVFAGAMLGTACGGKKPEPAAPSNTQPSTENASPQPPDPCAGQQDPCAASEDPCAGQDPCAAANPCRPRPNTDPCARPTGRGFVLS